MKLTNIDGRTAYENTTLSDLRTGFFAYCLNTALCPDESPFLSFGLKDTLYWPSTCSLVRWTGIPGFYIVRVPSKRRTRQKRCNDLLSAALCSWKRCTNGWERWLKGRRQAARRGKTVVSIHNKKVQKQKRGQRRERNSVIEKLVLFGPSWVLQLKSQCTFPYDTRKPPISPDQSCRLHLFAVTIQGVTLFVTTKQQQQASHYDGLGTYVHVYRIDFRSTLKKGTRCHLLRKCTKTKRETERHSLVVTIIGC